MPTAKIDGNFWCCSSVQHPNEILFHSSITGSKLLPVGSMFYGPVLPFLYSTKRAAKDKADSWNALYDADEPRVAPRRIHLGIEIDMGKKKEAQNGKQS